MTDKNLQNQNTRQKPHGISERVSKFERVGAWSFCSLVTIFAAASFYDGYTKEQAEIDRVRAMSPVARSNEIATRAKAAGIAHERAAQKECQLKVLGNASAVLRADTSNQKPVPEFSELLNQHGAGALETCYNGAARMAKIEAARVEKDLQAEFATKADPAHKPDVPVARPLLVLGFLWSLFLPALRKPRAGNAGSGPNALRQGPG